MSEFSWIVEHPTGIIEIAWCEDFAHLVTRKEVFCVSSKKDTQKETHMLEEGLGFSPIEER